MVVEYTTRQIQHRLSKDAIGLKIWHPHRSTHQIPWPCNCELDTLDLVQGKSFCLQGVITLVYIRIWYQPPKCSILVADGLVPYGTRPSASIMRNRIRLTWRCVYSITLSIIFIVSKQFYWELWLEVRWGAWLVLYNGRFRPSAVTNWYEECIFVTRRFQMWTNRQLYAVLSLCMCGTSSWAKGGGYYWKFR